MDATDDPQMTQRTQYIIEMIVNQNSWISMIMVKGQVGTSRSLLRGHSWLPFQQLNKLKMKQVPVLQTLEILLLED